MKKSQHACCISSSSNWLIWLASPSCAVCIHECACTFLACGDQVFLLRQISVRRGKCVLEVFYHQGHRPHTHTQNESSVTEIIVRQRNSPLSQNIKRWLKFKSFERVCVCAYVLSLFHMISVQSRGCNLPLRAFFKHIVSA